LKNVVPFYQKTNDELWEITKDLLTFSMERYEDVINFSLVQFFDQFSITEEEKEYLYPYYFWWLVFCSRETIPNNQTIYQMFLRYNRSKFKKKPHLKKALFGWQYVIPSFFYIEERASKRVFGLYDIFDYRELKVVVVPQETFKQPDSKDVLAGLALPLADGGYFAVIDFLVIPDKIRAPLISKLIQFYQSDITVSTGEFFSKHYPEMLKMTIEHLIENNSDFLISR
jgi:hypothetical protein